MAGVDFHVSACTWYREMGKVAARVVADSRRSICKAEAQAGRWSLDSPLRLYRDAWDDAWIVVLMASNQKRPLDSTAFV